MLFFALLSMTLDTTKVVILQKFVGHSRKQMQFTQLALTHIIPIL